MIHKPKCLTKAKKKKMENDASYLLLSQTTKQFCGGMELFVIFGFKNKQSNGKIIINKQYLHK